MTNEDKIIQLYPKIQNPIRDLLKAISDKGIKGGIFAGLRTYDEQNAIYAKGRTKPGDIVTNAKPGQSFHNFGLAVDFVFYDSKNNWTWAGPYDTVVKIVRSMGFETGADFPNVDKPHIQMSYGQDLRKLDYIYQHSMAAGNPLHAVWEYLDVRKV